MKKEIADEWIRVLRSGQYRQGKQRLRRGDQFCCLGVLCEIAVSAGQPILVIDPDESFLESRDRQRVWAYDGETTGLPTSVANWAGIEWRSILVPTDAVVEVLGPVRLGEVGGGLHSWVEHPRVSLATLNDRGATFKEIADVIERTWESL